MKIFRSKYFLPLTIFVLLFLFYSCGEGTIDVGPETYTPKIAIQGFVYPGKKVENIFVTNNIPLASVSGSSIVLLNAEVKITDLSSGNIFKLSFNPAKFSYEYNGTDLQIDFGKSYRLDVSAIVDGLRISANSTTTVPLKGFHILKDQSTLGVLKYREKDGEGNVKSFNVFFEPSPATRYYPISIVALDASMENFIYDNAYFEIEEKDLKDDFDYYKYQFKALQNVKSDADRANYKVEWLDTWFYSRYRLIIYAADENFRLFAQTHKNVQEFDGNFHEPRMNINGEGIGVFGSAIADTVYFEVVK